MATPSDLETKILQVLWAHGPSTAREVLTGLDDGKTRAYTTILTTLQIMERKVFVTRTREGVSDRWRALIGKRRTVGKFWKNFIAKFCGGRTSVAVQHLLDVQRLDATELAEIERMIREYKERK
jgi:BlaI family transcriptional regulator, penicillinase repressor